jgi:hypothetical protein
MIAENEYCGEPFFSKQIKSFLGGLDFSNMELTNAELEHLHQCFQRVIDEAEKNKK